MITIREAVTEDIPLIQAIAIPTWQHTYSSILSAEQLDYMLQHIYGKERMEREIAGKLQQYLLLFDKDKAVGFAAYAPRSENPDVYKLYKLYCLPETKGQGLGKQLILEVERRVRQAGRHILELNVNKYNPAKGFYEKMGYEVVYEEDIPIGAFWMNDFVMRKHI